MSNLHPLRPREVERALHHLGFEKSRQKGSHATLRHPDGRRTVVPIHPGKDISPHLLADVLKQIGVSEDEFLAALMK